MPDDNAQDAQTQQPEPQEIIERAQLPTIIDTKGIQEGIHALITNPVVQQVAGDVAGFVKDTAKETVVAVVSAVATSKIINSNTPPPTNTSEGGSQGTSQTK